jgi:hypothetical protein
MLKGAKMPRKSNHRNEYSCCIEMNQNGKYCVRIHAKFARRGWVLPVYFLVSKLDRAVRKLEQALQFLQREEDRLWFWGVDRSDDPNVSAEMLSELGLHLDRRAEFPRRNERLVVPPERQVPGFMLEPMRRSLAESVESSSR